MNKFAMALVAGLLCSSQLFASHSDCFRNYTVTLVNKSGGEADFKRTSGVRGASRSTEMSNNSSIQLLIQKRGASISVKAGPEGNKSTRDVKFYSKDYRNYRPTVTLNQKGFLAEGFSQKPINFTVKIENQSGGTARIVDSCDASGRGNSIGDGRSVSINVKPSGYIIVEAGPEKQKVRSKIVFAEQTGEQPSVTLVKRGFMSRGIQSRNLEIQAQRVPAAIARPRHSRPLVEQEVSKKVQKAQKKVSFSRSSAKEKASFGGNRHVRRTN